METEQKTKRGCNINKRQKELLVEFLQNHSDLLKGKFTSTFTHRKAKQLWEEIAYQLNEIPNGANKSWDQWRKTWQDLKKNVKTKSSRITSHMKGTGGGAASEEQLEPLETTIVELMCPTLINGHSDVSESTVEINLMETEDISLNPSKTPTPPSPLQPTVTSPQQPSTSSAFQGNTEIGQLVAPSTSKFNKKKITKAKRYETSFQMSKNLLTTCNTKTANERAFYEKKLALLREDMLARRDYENRKISLLETNQKILENILLQLVTKLN